MNIDFNNPDFYRSILIKNNADQEILKKSLQKQHECFNVTQLFVQAVSEPKWLKDHIPEGLRAVKLLPKSCISEAQQLVRAAIELDQSKIARKEIDQIVRDACAAKEYDLILAFSPFIEKSLVDELSLLSKIAKDGTGEQLITACQHKNLISTNHEGASPLHLAARAGNTEAIATLVQLGADIHSPDSQGQSPMHYAATGGKPEAIAKLVALGSSVNPPNRDGSPLHYAAQAGQTDAIVRLIELGAHIDTAYNAKQSRLLPSFKGSTPLHWAAVSGKTESIAKLIELGANIYFPDCDGNTPLHAAVICGKRDVITKLIELGSDINFPNWKGETPLDLAFNERKNIIAGKLLELGAEPPIKGGKPIHYAAMAGNMEKVVHLIKQGIDINSLDDLGQSPLLYAAMAGRGAVVKKLIEMNANCLLLNSQCDTALSVFLEAAPTELEIIDLLMSKDNGLTAEIVERRLLANRFGLEGTSVINKKVFQLEGMTLGLPVLHLTIALKSYYSQLESALTTSENCLWNNICKDLSPSTLAAVETLDRLEIIKILGNTVQAVATSLNDDASIAKKRHQEGLPVGVTTFFFHEPHIVCLALYGNRLARCNRGWGCESPGILVNSIHDWSNIDHALEQSIPSITQDYFTTYIRKDLELSDEIYLAQKDQKVGNCSVANTNSMELALLYLQLEPLIGQKAAEELARAIKRGRTKDTRIGSVEDYLDWHRHPRPSPPDLNLIGKLYKKTTANKSTDNQVRALIRKWADDLNIDPSYLGGVSWHR